MKERIHNITGRLKVASFEFVVFLIILIYLCIVVPVTHFDLW